jgi:hypothetical protein
VVHIYSETKNKMGFFCKELLGVNNASNSKEGILIVGNQQGDFTGALGWLFGIVAFTKQKL